MADKELAIKLAKRFNKLSFDADEGARTFANSSQVPQTVIPEAPPLPPQGQQTPPFRTVSGDEYTDMDKLIEQTLHNMEVTSRETPTNPFTSVYMPQSKSSRIGDAITSQVKIHEPQVVESSNLSPLLPKCTAPIVPIIHHKGSQHEKSMKFVSDDLLLQKERDELEAKLAKQRQKRSTVPAGTENTTHFAVNGSEELRMTSETTISQLSPIGSPLPPPVFPKSTSIDPVLMESQKIESQWEKPPPTSKKPTCSIVMKQTLSSPTCSTTLQSSPNNDGNELAAKLARRNMIVEGEPVEQAKPPKLGIYSEFHEFTRKQIKYFMETFKKYDEDHDNFIDFNELKRMMEKLGEAQTHIALKNMLKLVDEDQDGKVSPREFMLIFRYASTGQLSCAEVFNELAASVDVIKEGVHAAADFFQAKIEEQTKLSKFEEEIRAEQEERKLQQAEKKERRQQFLANKAVFI